MPLKYREDGTTYEVADKNREAVFSEGLKRSMPNGDHPTNVSPHGYVFLYEEANETWVCPPGVTKVFLTACGRGGNGGAGFQGDDIRTPGAGGGSGAWCDHLEIEVTPGEEYPIVVSKTGNTALFGKIFGKGSDGDDGTKENQALGGAGGVGVGDGVNNGTDGNDGGDPGTSPNATGGQGGDFSEEIAFVNIGKMVPRPTSSGPHADPPKTEADLVHGWSGGGGGGGHASNQFEAATDGAAGGYAFVHFYY